MKYYQPEFDGKIWEEQGFFSFMVYISKNRAQEDFPDHKKLNIRMTKLKIRLL